MNWIRIFDSIESAKLAVPEQSSRLVILREVRICLVNHQNKFFAVEDRCPHLGASLSKGIVNYMGDVICPLHEYRFNSKTGDECDNKCDRAKTYQLKVDNEGVFIEMPE